MLAHHDGITGTATESVVSNYVTRMVSADEGAQRIAAAAAAALMGGGPDTTVRHACVCVVCVRV